MIKKILTGVAIAMLVVGIGLVVENLEGNGRLAVGCGCKYFAGGNLIFNLGGVACSAGGESRTQRSLT